MADEDIDLVERFQRGDLTAFDMLVNKYQHKIYNIVYHHIRNVEDAYDLSQEVFLRAFKALGRFKKKSSFYTWLYCIAVNVCIDYGRHNARFQTIPIEEWARSHDTFDAGELDLSRSPAKVVELQELRFQIARAIDQLPPKQKAVFIMKRQEGLPLREIARILGCSVGTVKAHLFHATCKLAHLLAPYLENEG